MKYLTSITILIIVLQTVVHVVVCKWAKSQLPNCGTTLFDRRTISGGNRIVGGSPVIRGQFPWQASVQKYRNGLYGHSCGGVILNTTTIITAAHCIHGLDASNIRVVVGADTLSGMTNAQANLFASSITKHPLFNAETFASDIALIQVSTPIDIDGSGGYINGICLPDQGQKFTQYVTASGWGSTQAGGIASDVLNFVTSPIISLPKCRSQYGQNWIKEGMLCSGLEAGGQGPCQGDAGGPLIQDDGTGRAVLVGIYSWGRQCALPGSPGIYTEISSFRDWIDGVSE